MDLADIIHDVVRRLMDESSADWRMGTVTALTPDSTAGTLLVDIGGGTTVKARRAATYTSPVVGDRVWADRNRLGEWRVTAKLA
ncbi:hypothetical protein [Embleya sp. NPDC005971]|uniref:hypothetical protein n=1 Tax=Embleya sp. NPDC005971 TaxID=3156724 RepID=UPI0033F0C0AE